MPGKQEILDAYQFRHACKSFDENKKIPKEDFDTILETGRLSPSSFGFEPWKFVVIQSPELRDKILPVAVNQPQVKNASHLLLLLAKKGEKIKPHSPEVKAFMNDVQHLPPEVQEMLGNFFGFYVSDLAKLDTDRKIDDWAAKQTYIPLGNMMTTAAMLGIDSCPIEGFNTDDLTALLEKELGIDPKDYSPSALIGFGYRQEDPKRPKTRRPVEDVVQWVE